MNNQILFQRYQILTKLGEGGFGTTYLAEDLQMPSRRRCVVKQLKPLTYNSQIYQLIKERFQKEAAILEELGSQSRQIPQLYAYFEDQGQFYLVQEYIDGDTLSSLVEHKGLFDENTVTEFLLKVLPILEYVHNHHIVHRDIKPDNIILRRSDNSPVLIDFGAVKETMGTLMTSSGSPTGSIVIGTPGFMPSEQSAGRPVYATDVYALGLTAIYLLSGKTPQELETDPLTGEIIWKLHAPNLNPTLAEVLDKATKSFHKERFPTARAMLEALQSSNSTTSKTSKTSASSATVIISSSNQKTLAPSLNVNWRKNFLIGGMILLPLVLGVYYLQNRESQTAQTEEKIPQKSPDISDKDNFEDRQPEFSSRKNQFELINFPQPSCGDSIPTNSSLYPLKFYPVFIVFSEENLVTIKNNFCQDAFSKIRKETGEKSIQIASFYNLDKAQEFTEFITQKLGNGEVGEPTLVVQAPAQINIQKQNEQSSLESPLQVPQGQNLDDNQAREIVENLYFLVSEKRYEEARQLFDYNLSNQFHSEFFNQFTRVTVEDLQIISKSDSMINFQGKNTYVYPDGSTQRELRSYTVRNINGEPKITASELIKVIKFR